MKTILCSTDFSKNASHASDYAAALANEFNARLLLVHVYETPTTFDRAPLTMVKDAEEEIKHWAKKKITTLQKAVQRKYKTLAVESYALGNAPADAITRLAKKEKADLVVLGTTGKSRLERLLMGSTTARIIRLSECPVLCVPKETSYKGIDKIVFATDLHSDNINAALSIVDFAKHFNAEICFLYVDDKHLVHSNTSISAMTKKIRSKVRYPKLSGYISGNHSITEGIAHFLKKHKADVLVMMTHEKSFPESLFSQSITKLMSHQTRIPLLALKP